MSLVVWLGSGIAIATTAATSVFALRCWSDNQRFKSLRILPSPSGTHWLFGNAPQVLAAVKEKKYFQLLYDWASELGSIYVYWLGNLPVVILSDPNLIETTIINGMKNGSLVRSKRSTKAWNDIDGPILLGTNATDWKWRRKAWNIEFTPNAVSQHLPTISLACNQIVEKIKETASSKEVKSDRLFVELTMRVISCLLLGIPVDSSHSTNEGPPLHIAETYNAMSVLGYRFLRIATGEKRWMKYLPIKTSQEYWQARKYMENFLIPRIDLALQMRSNPERVSKEVSTLFANSMLVKIAIKEPKYDRASLIAESIELLIAGTDTTAHSLSFAIGELSLNQRVFEKAQKIVDDTWDNYGGINFNSLKDLSYICAIFKETLRLYSVASGSTSLEAKRNTTIANQVIPTGTKIFWSMLAAGRDAKFYSNPKEFFPERWLEQGGINHLPPMIDFGSGLHRCLGEHLATIEATVMLTMLLRYFDWKLVNGRSSLKNLEQNLLIFPRDGMPVTFTARNFRKI